MNKREVKKLELHKETLRSLDKEALKKAAGDGNPTQQSRCKCCRTDCCG